MSTSRDRRRSSLAPFAGLAVVVGLAVGLARCAPDVGVGPRVVPATPVAVESPPAEPADDVAAAPVPAPPSVPVRSADLTTAGAVTAPPPAEVTLPTLDVTVPVDPVGVQDDGQMEIPPQAERAGWYRFGAAPGDAGTTVIAAHVDSVASAGLGPFARLVDVAVGDPVRVTTADGVAHEYVVESVGAQPKDAIAWDGVFQREGAHRVVLITCGGTFRQDVRSYSDNVLVVAVPQGSG